MRWRVPLLIVAMLASGAACAQSLIVANPVRARTVISPSDVTVGDVLVAGAVSDLALVVGMEAKTNLYPGRPVLFSDIGPPAIVNRNQTVVMVYKVGTLTITTEGRALERGGAGERIRVMNMDSRLTVTGLVRNDGTVEVGG